MTLSWREVNPYPLSRWWATILGWEFVILTCTSVALTARVMEQAAPACACLTILVTDSCIRRAHVFLSENGSDSTCGSVFVEVMEA